MDPSSDRDRELLRTAAERLKRIKVGEALEALRSNRLEELARKAASKSRQTG